MVAMQCKKSIAKATMVTRAHSDWKFMVHFEYENKGENLPNQSLSKLLWKNGYKSTAKFVTK